MKRIFLTCIVAMSIFVADAQNKKAKKGTINYKKKEAKSKAEFAKKESERQQNIEAERVERLWADSVRKVTDSTTEAKFQADRLAWKDTRIKQIDSTNMENWKVQGTQTEQWNKIMRNRDEVNRAAKLDNNQGRQVNFINQTYHSKAQLIRDNTTLTEEQRKEQLSSLNTERRARIQTVIGKSREKRLDRERKKYYTKNGSDMEVAWIDEAEGFVQNK